jgi:hypothetical protein
LLLWLSWLELCWPELHLARLLALWPGGKPAVKLGKLWGTWPLLLQLWRDSQLRLLELLGSGLELLGRWPGLQLLLGSHLLGRRSGLLHLLASECCECWWSGLELLGSRAGWLGRSYLLGLYRTGGLSRSLWLGLLDWAETKLELRSRGLLRSSSLRNWNSLGNLRNRSGRLRLDRSGNLRLRSGCLWLGLDRSGLDWSGLRRSRVYCEGIWIDRGAERSGGRLLAKRLENKKGISWCSRGGGCCRGGWCSWS